MENLSSYKNYTCTRDLKYYICTYVCNTVQLSIDNKTTVLITCMTSHIVTHKHTKNTQNDT